jgi:recombinational DNA repair protein (RecF pathway)
MNIKKETVGETLQRLARESLPRHFEGGGGEYNSKRYCVCGEPLPPRPKTRQHQLVCDDCAAIMPRLLGGRRPTSECAECGTVYPQKKMKMKDRRLYCKKCLKIKFGIDF